MLRRSHLGSISLAVLSGTLGLAGTSVTPVVVSAGEQVIAAGTKVNKGDTFKVLLDDRSAGRQVFVFTYHAVYKQTKGGNLVDGALNKGEGYGDLIQGRGHMSGFDVFEKEGDTYKAGWVGECDPVIGSDGKAVSNCSGGWSVIPASGTGRFSGLSGVGTWNGHVLRDGDFEVEWTATLEK